MGPTASGKTGVAVELVQHLPVEIISVDSALVYRDMNIGTAKPDAATLAVAPHHLIDVIDPTQSYSAAQFRGDALRLMAEITARGHIPLLVGGTMLYFKALREGLNDLPQADPALRMELEDRARQVGWPAMHQELARLDPETAARLQPTDAQRIQRALEVCLLSDRPMSALLAEEQQAELPYRLIQLALLPGDRAVLHARIAQRFDEMLKQGLVEELESLKTRYALTPDLPSMRCVGYRQAWQYLEGECTAAEMRELGIIATRQLAKRQLTWLRGMEGVTEFDCLADDLAERVRAFLRN
ncbi:MAG: tRNA (adenosine(37)-N6)-dimethylallyltransferase MiaA [Gammaproteobacteria bacterium]|nr:tRNA (adenosine(37)-N6)-dimethylallyltransferase MiaA [Gammaproteobacteria bacterium]MBU1733595.1 tRNA (adenosine(37)-N6)-dimethylallyltransferase MiaA [Gammaproteobacteria bacterium]MBU1891689.1 tRNA (adenosine(37)-N6)-dimethylallyltransferase MiaA [Gammaproteobacteria bacterium]